MPSHHTKQSLMKVIAALIILTIASDLSIRSIDLSITNRIEAVIPNLPNCSYQLLPHPSGGVIAIAQEGFYYLPKFDASWQLLKTKMASPRLSHVAFWVPDSITNCTEKGAIIISISNTKG